VTTEVVLLLGLFAFLIGGAFFGPNGPRAVFDKSGPRLGARLEQHLHTGRQFKIKSGGVLQYEVPPVAPPDGTL